MKSKPVNIPQITILLDHGYHPEKIIEELKKIYPAIMTKIRFKLSPKPSKLEKENLGKKGFVPVQAWWVMERTNPWMERCKSLTKNFVCAAFRRKRTLENATSK
ncbi:transposase [Okeania sp. SIO1H4]|uniref:transposase n=1 Tax=Okeania sp. SIO1H4 TaxID=2607776 RepID=UPI00257ECBE8|nr:transposase [Okeania sp. SIO1H4]